MELINFNNIPDGEIEFNENDPILEYFTELEFNKEYLITPFILQ